MLKNAMQLQISQFKIAHYAKLLTRQNLSSALDG